MWKFATVAYRTVPVPIYSFWYLIAKKRLRNSAGNWQLVLMRYSYKAAYWYNSTGISSRLQTARYRYYACFQNFAFLSRFFVQTAQQKAVCCTSINPIFPPGHRQYMPSICDSLRTPNNCRFPFPNMCMYIADYKDRKKFMTY